MGNVQTEYYNHQDKLNSNDFTRDIGPKWMSTCRDHWPVATLAIPGTHDSCARHGGDMAECQSLSLTDQMNAGIRFLDIRCRWYKNVLTIHHGPVYQKMNFNGVLREVTHFLKTHPTEGILMSIKQEYNAVGNDEKTTFDEVVQRYCKAFGDYFVAPFSGAVTCGQLRGKILVFKRYGGTFPYGVIEWGDCGGIQDHYDIPQAMDIDKVKKPAVYKFYKLPKDKTKFYVNFLSGWGAGAYPYTIARSMNPWAAELIKKQKKQRNCITVMDFPGWQLIKDILK